MGGVGDCRIYVEVINEVVRVIPPVVFSSRLGWSDFSGKNFVILQLNEVNKVDRSLRHVTHKKLMEI